MQDIQLIARYFNQEITVYEVTDESVFVLCGQLIPEEEEEGEEEEKISTNDHRYSQRARFYYHRPRKAAKIYECAHCGARFTQSYKLLHHAARCTNGQTKIVCRGEKIWAPEPLYERTFHPRGKYGKTACYWIEIEARRHGIHIHYQLCWHRDERLIAGIQWTGIISRAKQYISSTGVISTDVHNVTRTEITFCTGRKERM